MYVRYVLVQYAAVCHYRRLCVCVRVPGVPVLVKCGHGLYDQISPGQEILAHTHTHTTNDNDIRPHIIQELNKRTYTEFSLVTA